VVIARLLGLSETTIGITVVALGTTLPELAATLVASAKGQGDLAAGNVVGSNIFNVLSVLGVAALANPLDASAIRVTDLVVMILFGIAVLPLARRKEKLDRWEGALLLVAYVAYVATLVTIP
jgi:cation:H+ antiporter